MLYSESEKCVHKCEVLSLEWYKLHAPVLGTPLFGVIRGDG
jgi:hypothetical protein